MFHLLSEALAFSITGQERAGFSFAQGISQRRDDATLKFNEKFVASLRRGEKIITNIFDFC